MLLACLTACSTENIKDTKDTKDIVRHICPPVVGIPPAVQKQMAAALQGCIDPKNNLSPFTKFLCNQYIYALSNWKVSRDQSRVCYAQK